jgi:hypothetical protein
VQAAPAAQVGAQPVGGQFVAESSGDPSTSGDVPPSGAAPRCPVLASLEENWSKFRPHAASAIPATTPKQPAVARSTLSLAASSPRHTIV